MVNAASAQLAGGVIVAKPPAPAVTDKRLAGLGFLAAKNPGPQPALLGGIGELQRHAVVLLRKPLEPPGDARLAQVAQHDQQRPVFQHGGKLIEFLGQRSLLVEPVVAQLVEPEEHAVARQAWLGIECAFAAADYADRAHSIQRGQSQPPGDLYCPGVLARADAGHAHRAGGVDEQVNRHLLWRLVFLDEWPAHAGGDAPVDLFHRVAGLVRAALRVLDAGADKWRRIGAVLQAVSQPANGDGELASVQSVARFEATGERFHALAQAGCQPLSERISLSTLTPETPSASASYLSRMRCSNTSSAKAYKSSGTT